MTRIALLCSGLGNIRRGHESFARSVFDLLKDDLDITLFKGGGEAAEREIVVPNVPRTAASLDAIKLPVSQRWLAAAQDSERMRVEAESFAWGALGLLLAGDFQIIHCLEQEVCQLIWNHRHLFRRTPIILWSNGGAIPGPLTPDCDFIQEHTEHNLRQSVRHKAFCIEHGVDTQLFSPGPGQAFRQAHGIPQDAFMVLSVGAIATTHKRMDYVVREVSTLPGAWLVVAGQPCDESDIVRRLGRELMGERALFMTLPHQQLPQAFRAANVFVLASLFETFGIVLIEAMACGVPVVCSDHPNQQSIVREGIFVNMAKQGALGRTLAETPATTWQRLAQTGRSVVLGNYDLQVLKARYMAQYARMAASAPAPLPTYGTGRRLAAHGRSLWRAAAAWTAKLQLR